MSEPQVTERRSRRGGGRDARRQLRTGGGGGASAPFITRNIPPVDILSDEATEVIEANAETILEEIGIDFRDDTEALDILRNVGCDVKGERVHFPRGLARQLCATAPASFTQHARNSGRSVEIGGNKDGVCACLWPAICS